MARLNIERQEKLEPKRIKYAEDKLIELGANILQKDDTKIVFSFKNMKITIFPYSGWFSGKGVVDGRGIDNLLKQLKQSNNGERNIKSK